MDRQAYKHHILKKYKVDPVLYAQYSRLDAMKYFHKSIKKEEMIFKGAFNLLINYGYQRGSDITKDQDFSVIGISLEEAAKHIESIKKDDEGLYAFEVIGINKLAISTSGYNGVEIKMKATVDDSGFHIPFSLDIAVEELEQNDSNFSRDKYNNRFYTIERTLADKYVSMFQHGASNGRAKDYVDIKALYGDSNKETFYKISKELIEARGVTTEQIDTYKDEYQQHVYIIDYDLHEEFEEILKNTV